MRIWRYWPGTEKLLKGTVSGMMALGKTKAVIAICFEEIPFPKPKKEVLGWGAVRLVELEEDAGGGRIGTLGFNPTPKITFAKWVGTATFGGFPMTLREKTWVRKEGVKSRKIKGQLLCFEGERKEGKKKKKEDPANILAHKWLSFSHPHSS